MPRKAKQSSGSRPKSKSGTKPASDDNGDGDTIDHVERLMNVVALLLKSRVPISKSDLFKQIEGYADGSREAIERKFEHDKNRLATAGIVLKFTETEAGQGYVIDYEASLLPRVDLTAEERLILETLARSYLPRATGEFAKQLRLALLKLRFDNADLLWDDENVVDGTKGVDPVDSTAPVMQGQVVTEREQEQTNLERFLHAVMTRKQIAFHYLKTGTAAKKEERKVDPYGVAFVNGAWYVEGYDHVRSELRTFKLSRIEGRARLLNEGMEPDFERPANYVVRSMVQRLTMPTDPEARYEKVVLRIAPDAAFMIREWALGLERADHATYVEQADGSGRLTLKSPWEGTVWRMVANYAPLVTVVEPTELRQRFQARLKALRDRIK